MLIFALGYPILLRCMSTRSLLKITITSHKILKSAQQIFFGVITKETPNRHSIVSFNFMIKLFNKKLASDYVKYKLLLWFF